MTEKIDAARRGIYAREQIRSGQILQPEMLAVRRPRSEIPANHIEHVVGRRAKIDISAEEELRWDYLEN